MFHPFIYRDIVGEKSELKAMLLKSWLEKIQKEIGQVARLSLLQLLTKEKFFALFPRFIMFKTR